MKENDSGFYDYMKPILSGTIISLISMGILMFIVSLVMTKVDFPLGFVVYIATGIIGISTFIGSFVGSKILEQKGFFIGLCVAISVLMIILLVNLSIDPQGFGTIAIIKTAVTLIGGIAGGIAGVNGRHSKIKI